MPRFLGAYFIGEVGVAVSWGSDDDDASGQS
jgi:hypothetical protein